jgi:hypothetical protein
MPGSKSGHDERVWRNEGSDCFVRNPTSTAALFADTPSRSRRDAPELMHLIFAQNRGRGERRVPAAPAASCALGVVERTRVTTSTPESPGIPARNGFNGFLRALPGDRAHLPPSSTDMFCLSPVGPTRLRELDASVGASGPHNFAVRVSAVRLLAW